jgi:hypothetical protein
MACLRLLLLLLLLLLRRRLLTGSSTRIIITSRLPGIAWRRQEPRVEVDNIKPADSRLLRRRGRLRWLLLRLRRLLLRLQRVQSKRWRPATSVCGGSACGPRWGRSIGTSSSSSRTTSGSRGCR